MGRLFRNRPGTAEGKYGVLGRDGEMRGWPHFVLGAKDPAAPAALLAYARRAEELGLPPDYTEDVRDEALAFDQYRLSYGVSDAGKEVCRPATDHPLALAMIRGRVTVADLWEIPEVQRLAAGGVTGGEEAGENEEDPGEEDYYEEEDEDGLGVKGVIMLVSVFAMLFFVGFFGGVIYGSVRDARPAAPDMPAAPLPILQFGFGGKGDAPSLSLPMGAYLIEVGPRGTTLDPLTRPEAGSGNDSVGR